MGFYGNITNTSKTTFQFDKTYSNRNQMMLNAGNDGVYPGRFVLVDYDVAIDNDYFYKPDPLNPNGQCWMYDGQIYTGAPVSVDINGTIVYKEAPDIRTQLNFETSGFTKGRCVAVPIGQRISNISGASEYKRIISRTETGYVSMTISRSEYDKFMDDFEAANEDTPTYFVVELYPYNYEKGVYYTTADNVNYVLAEDEFDENTVYYRRAVTNDIEIYIIGNAASDVVLQSTWVTSKELEVGMVYQIQKGCQYTINAKYDEYWVLTNDTDPFVWQAAADNASTYTLNASIDRAVYGSGRGYDATVWQKVIKLGRDTYVMIAELNSVVPTFDITADAPSTVPLAPHFDKDSTNIYYKLHVQPNWGIRTKASRPDLKGPSIDKTGAQGGDNTLTIDTVYYPSDQTTTWKSKLYNSADGTEREVFYTLPSDSTTENPSGSWETQETENSSIPAAIYYNKDGFNKSRVSESADLIIPPNEGGNWRFNPSIYKSGWTPENKIELKPTGLSGKRYDTHNATAGDEPQVDTQELTVMLPALGDAVSHMWDLIYGGYDTNDVIRQTGFRNQDIEWENARGGLNRNGLRMVGSADGNAYNVAETNTLAGCINSVHDLMGMIITPENSYNLGLNLDNLNTDRIYYVNGDSIYLEKNPNGFFVYIQISEELYWQDDFKVSDYFVYDDATGTIRNAKASTDSNKILHQEFRVTEEQWNYIKTLQDFSNSYVRKKLTYDYTEIDFNDEGIFEFKPTQPETEDFNPEDYWVQDETVDGGYRPGTQEDVNAGADLYDRVLQGSAVFDPAGLTPFDGTKYFYQDFTSSENLTDLAKDIPEIWLKDYVRDEVYHPNHKYFTINPETDLVIRPLSGEYAPGKYFHFDNQSYIYDNNPGPTLNRTYYNIDPNKVHSIKEEGWGGYDGVYVPGEYYYKHPDTGEYILDNEPTGTMFGNQKVIHYGLKTTPQDSDKPLYTQQTVYIPITYAQIIETGYNLELYVYDSGSGRYERYFGETIDENTSYYLEEIRLIPSSGHLVIDPTPLKLALFQPNTFYFKDEIDGQLQGYTIVTPDKINALSDSTQEFYVFGVKREETAGGKIELNYVYTDQEKVTDPDYACKMQSEFYVPHRYHFLSSDDGYGSYLLDHYQKKTHNPYYMFKAGPTPVDENIKFYEPNKYYTKNEITGEYEVIRDPEMPTDTPIYDKKAYYVIEDKAGVYEPGAEWNVFADKVPSTVTLGTREEAWEIVQMKGFARNLNTIHGLILRMNQLLETGDKYTRDRTTIQGTLNTLNDLIARFDKMKPAHFTIIDEYGRVQSSDWNTQQVYMDGDTKVITADKQKASPSTFRKGIHADVFPQAADVANMEQQWITMHVNDDILNPKITIHHNFQRVDDKPKTLDMNGNGDKVVLYEPIVDKMGHIVGEQNTTLTLPFGFKTIKASNTADTVVTAPSTGINANGQIADNTQDILTFAASNRWVKLDNNSEDTIKIGHLLSPFVSGTQANTLYGLTSNQTVAQLDVDNTFEVPCLQFDEAGHILEARTHTITLPENFTKHVTTLSDVTNSDSLVGTVDEITPDTLTDTLTFAEGNRWINIAADKDNDKLTFSHYVKQFTETTSATDFNDTASGKTFTVQTIGWDRAGHLISSDKKTFTLPDNFKTLAITNSGKNVVSVAAENNGNLVADTLVDTATFDAGNRWLAYTANEEADKVTLYHVAPDANSQSALTTQTGDETPDFGATFLIPEVKYDETGHIFKVATHTVKIPLPNLVDDTTGNVMTALALEPTTGKFTITKENLSSLKLDGYTKSNDNTDVAAEDTLAEALSKLQTQINDEENARAQAIRDLLGGEEINAAFDTIKEISDWLAGNDSGADGVIDAIATLTGEEDVNGSVKQQIKAVVDTLGTAASKNEEDFATSDVLETTTFDYIVPTAHIMPAEGEEIEGEEPDPNGADDLLQNEEEVVVTKQTIAWLFNKVAELEARIQVLEAEKVSSDEETSE
jgi:hypothetical protein